MDILLRASERQYLTEPNTKNARHFYIAAEKIDADLDLFVKARRILGTHLLEDLLDQSEKKSPIKIGLSEGKIAWPSAWTLFILNMKNPPWISLLKTANGKRRTRLLSISDIQSLIESVEKYSWILGGTVRPSYPGNAQTTLAFIAKKGKYTTLGIRACSALRASPGRAWEELQPFNENHTSLQERIKGWCLTSRRPNGLPTVLQYP